MAVLATFKYEEDFLAGADLVKTAGIGRISLMSPLPLEDAQEVLGLKASPVRRFSLAGAIFGALSGFAMAVGTALVFILPTGGRAIIAVPPYLIITYEMTILLGVLFTLLGFFMVSRLPAWRDRPYTPESNIDRFVVVVEGAADADATRAETMLREAGAEETRRVEDGQ
jgi:molybdopterin-containing oxidoreductase family membrane subunit